MMVLKRRWYLFVAMLLAMTLPIGLWLVLNPHDRITYANFRKITTGIQRETVLAMLGPPSENRHPNFKNFGPSDETERVCFWTREERAIGVLFDVDGRVHSAIFTGTQEKPDLIEQIMEQVTKWVGSNQKKAQ